MKARKITALVICILTAFALFAVFASAESSCAHEFITIYTDKNPTCTAEGTATNFCTKCNAFVKVTLPIDPTNHRYGEWVTKTEATCIAEGVKERKCVRVGCENPLETGVIPVDDSKHIADNKGWTTVTAATCYAEGLEKAKCKVCGKDFTRSIPIHFDYAENSTDYKLVKKVEAKCNAVGYTQYQCLKCFELITVDRGVDANNHDFSDESLWEYPEDATCQSTDAKIIKHCKNQNSHILEVSYTPDHDFSGEVTVIEPYCENVNGESVLHEGKKITECRYCDATKEEAIAGAHSFGDWTEINGTCEYGGKASRTCDCGAKSETNVPFKAGTHLNYEVLRERESTCEYKGWTEIYCEVCNQTLKIYRPALGHIPGPWKVTDEANCQKSGLREVICKVCNQTLESEVIPQKDHEKIIIKNSVAPTCTESGLTPYYYCSMCLEGIAQEVIPALGHNYVLQYTPEEGAVRICDRCYEYEIIDDQGNTVSCDCLCHNSSGLAKMVWKIVIFFCKLFGFNQVCGCGIAHF